MLRSSLDRLGPQKRVQPQDFLRPRGVYRVEGSLPLNCHITDDTINGLLPAGSSIASEIEAKRLFLVDSSLMSEINV